MVFGSLLRSHTIAVVAESLIQLKDVAESANYLGSLAADRVALELGQDLVGLSPAERNLVAARDRLDDIGLDGGAISLWNSSWRRRCVASRILIFFFFRFGMSPFLAPLLLTALGALFFPFLLRDVDGGLILGLLAFAYAMTFFASVPALDDIDTSMINVPLPGRTERMILIDCLGQNLLYFLQGIVIFVIVVERCRTSKLMEEIE